MTYYHRWLIGCQLLKIYMSKVRIIQISELYGRVKKWESVDDVLPQVVDRLSALKNLHEQCKDNNDVFKWMS